MGNKRLRQRTCLADTG